MRKLLAAAAALAPLMAASGAQAEFVISNGRTTPILTSNATGSAPDSIRLASAGSITVTSGVAVTLDSSHSIDLDSGSKITMANSANGATAILARGGNTGNVLVGGAISVTDDGKRDKDANDLPTGDFANGTDRYGVRVTGAAPLVGNVIVERTGGITVQGNNSAAISIEAPLTGDLRSFGAISVTGNNSFGVHTTGDISGDVVLSAGPITTQGGNSVGVAIDGDVGGTLQLQTSVTSTGYRYTTLPPSKPTDPANVVKGRVYLEDLDADDLLQGGPAVRVAGNVDGGILLDTPPTYVGGVDGDADGDGVKNGDEDDDGDGKKNSEDTDRDGDGILDADEGTASLASIGGAAALQIGSATQAVDIGVIGTGANAFGLVNRGSISASGVYDKIDAQALRIGVDGGQTTTIANGVSNEGTISSLSAGGSSVAVRLADGASTPLFQNSGSITAQSVTDNANQVVGVLIEAGASLPTLTNSGTITTAVGGNKADVTAIRDLSGTLTSFTNTGGILATIVPKIDPEDDAAPVVTGTAAAVDLRANSSGVTFIQDGIVDIDPDDKTPPTDTDGDGVSDSKEPIISGAILLGSGADTVELRNGQVLGNIDFGAGADSLSISGGAVYRGALSNADGQLSIDVSDGVLDARQTTRVDITELNVGADGGLVVTVDPKDGSAGGFNVSGTATLADGAGLSVRFGSLLESADRFTVIKAGTLNYGDVDVGGDLVAAPYLYVVTAGADVAAGEVYVDARRRTAAEADMIKVEAQAFDAFYAALGDDDTLLNVFLAQTGRDGFFNLYEQILPDHSGGPLLSLSAGVDAVTRALTGRNAIATPGTTSAWVQEINFYAEKDKTDSYGFESEGFGVAGGVERGTNYGAFGFSVAFTSSDIEDPEAEAEENLSASLLELGLYWRAQGQNWTTWARAAGGYASFDSKRAIVANGINISNESSWNGFTLALAAGASYEHTMGRVNIRPEAYVEYFSLSEDAHTESGGADGFDLEIDDRDGHILSSVAAVNIGYGFGTNGWIRPELRLGWRQNISVDVGDTTARFGSGGSSFTLSPDSIEGGGPIAGLRLSVGNQLGMLSISADAEKIEDYVRYTLLLRASFKF